MGIDFFYKAAKTIQWVKGLSFQQMVLRQADIHIWKNKLGPVPHVLREN